jgi:uncharacterized protein YodC (DUF2158 family)
MMQNPVTADVETGALVWLKTGSPAMLVISLKRTDGLVMLEWFNGSELCREAFDSANLTFSDPLNPIVFVPYDDAYIEQALRDRA